MADKISITICGDGGCGKSSITLRLVRSQWMHEYDPTIEDYYSVTRTIDGLSYHLSITDTAGQEEYRSLWASSNLSSDAFLLVYDLTQPSSLDTLSHYMEMIDIETENRIEENSRLLKNDHGKLGEEEKKLVKPMPVKIVAGNKCDLKGDRRVSARHGLEWARRRGCGFMETSAREMVNIEETFALIVRRVIESRRQSALDPFNPNPYSHNHHSRYNSMHNTTTTTNNSKITNSPTTSSRTSIMNLTSKEKALKAVGSRPMNDHRTSTGTMTAMARTPALAPPLPPAAEDEDEDRMYLKEKKRGTTRLDGRPTRSKSFFGCGLGWLGKLRCWRRQRRRGGR